MRYTIRNVSADIGRAPRERARREAKSLNQVAIEALARDLDLERGPVRHRDLGAIAGSWVDDPEVDRALDEQRRR